MSYLLYMIIFDLFLACLILLRLNAKAAANLEAPLNTIDIASSPKSAAHESHKMGKVLIQLHGMH